MRNFRQALADAIAPPRCMGCLREGWWLCQTCHKDIQKFRKPCIICGKESAGGATCAACSNETSLSGVVSAGYYNSPLLKRGVQWLKFKGVRPVANTLALLLLPSLLSIAPLKVLKKDAWILSIPLHKRRLAQRGFNQSEEVVKALGAYTGIPHKDGLIRNRHTWTQTKLSIELRDENMGDAFSLKPDAPVLLKKKYIILVDDVTTTGATLSAAAKPLHESGVRSIWGLTVARG